MTELPKIVRQRLQAQASGRVDVHPDADLLTAFCERTLTASERQQVIAHLALCADCRAAVTLAVPPQAVDAEPVRPGREPRRFAWVHWFALAASVVVVATAVLQLPRSSQPSSEIDIVKPQRAPVATKQTKADDEGEKPAGGMTTANGPTLPASQSAASGDHDDFRASKAMAAAQQPKRDQSAPPALDAKLGEDKQQAPAPSQPTAGFGRARGVGPGVVGGARSGSLAGIASQATPTSPERERRDAPQAQAPPPPAARATEVAAVEENRRLADAPESRDTEAPKPAPSAVAGKSERQFKVADSDSAAGRKEASGEVANLEAFEQKSRAQAPATQPAYQQPSALPMKKHPTETETIAKAGSVTARYANKLKTSPRWTVSAAGGVQRSRDGGKTWQDVPIAEGVRFRAVAALDGNVWAGGESGALFHSSDAGETWTSRPLSGDGKLLETTPGFDILRIDITASGRVTVTTSQRQTFVSTDQGKTWTQQ